MTIEAHELGVSYDSVFDDLFSAIADGRREMSATVFRSFPHREVLADIATKVRDQLGVDAVQVNVITGGSQVTLVAAPAAGEEVIVPIRGSFCVLTVGADRPLSISDIQTDDFVRGHTACDQGVGSWTSAPVHVQGWAAGTICAVEGEARTWTPEEEGVLANAAERIGRSVEAWIG